MTNIPKYSYRWKLSEANFTKDKGKVFSCFSCGGGSTMGYKLAGFDVIGFNEIDPKMAILYIKNHKPEFQFVEAIQDFVKWGEFPDELFNLDILDGSPPCSSFSIAGNREKDWGKSKKFKEGQAKQVLDTLFFDFIELAGILKPKVVVSENVVGILMGNAKSYARRILQSFDESGYFVKEFLLKAKDMGVPQRRERVFFIAIRKDLASLLPVNHEILFDEFPLLNLKFNSPQIEFHQIYTKNLNDAAWTNQDKKVWPNRKRGDRKYADVLLRMDGKYSSFNSGFIYSDEVVKTITSTEASKLTLFDEPRRMNSKEMILSQTFPLDYDFGSDKASKIQYVLGMSVPPVMMAHLADRIYEQWKPIFNL